MGTTTKMAIPYPEATGLVKDGWEDMKDIATQVDAKSGLVLISTTSFSAVTSVSLPNGTFTNNYSCYRIVLQVDSSSTGVDVGLRMRLSGTDDTNNVYYSARQNNFSYNTNYFGSAGNPATKTIDFMSCDVAANGGMGTVDLVSPQEAKRTKGKLLGCGTYFNAHGYFLHESNTQFDSMSFVLSGAGNITGKVLCYGYNQ